MITDGRLLQLIEMERERREFEKMQRTLRSMSDLELYEYHEKMKEKILK